MFTYIQINYHLILVGVDFVMHSFKTKIKTSMIFSLKKPSRLMKTFITRQDACGNANFILPVLIFHEQVLMN